MSSNRKKTARPQPAPKCSEMNEIDREIEKSLLSFRQQSALSIVASSPTISQAAHTAGISEVTLRRWLNDDAFRRELTRQRQGSAALARQEIQGLMLRSIAVIADALADPDVAIRLRAARYALSFAAQLYQTEKLNALNADVHDLNEILLKLDQTPPSLDPQVA